MAKLSNLSGEFLQMLNANEAYSIYRHMLTESMTSPGPPYCSHLQDARRRPCTAELLQGAKRTSVRITQRHSPPWTTLPRSWSSRGSWLRLGWGLSWREVTFLEDASHFWFDQGLRPAFSSCFPVLVKRCDKWFIYAIIYHRCRVFCLYMYLLLFPTPPDHVPTLGKISWKYSIVTLYHTLKRVHQTWRIFKIHYTSKELRGFWSHQQDSVANRIQWRPTK